MTPEQQQSGRGEHGGDAAPGPVAAGAPAGVPSGFEDEGGSDPEVDWTQGATGLLGSGVDPRRARLPGQEDEHLGEPRPAREYLAPGLEQETTPEPPTSG